MKLTDRVHLTSEEGLKNRAAGQYWRGQAGKARKRNVKWILNKLGIKTTQRNVYFVLKYL